MKFNSQICTSRSQSERLLALGLKKETADMTLQTTLDVCYTIPFQESVEYFENRHLPPHPTILPAWSLHRLMCLCPEKLVDWRERVIKDMYTPNEYELWVSLDQCSYLDVTARYGGETLGFFYEGGNLYDALIACIEWLIKNGNFNKEYLERI